MVIGALVAMVLFLIAQALPLALPNQVLSQRSLAVPSALGARLQGDRVRIVSRDGAVSRWSLSDDRHEPICALKRPFDAVVGPAGSEQLLLRDHHGAVARASMVDCTLSGWVDDAEIRVPAGWLRVDAEQPRWVLREGLDRDALVERAAIDAPAARSAQFSPRGDQFLLRDAAQRPLLVVSIRRDARGHPILHPVSFKTTLKLEPAQWIGDRLLLARADDGAFRWIETEFGAVVARLAGPTRAAAVDMSPDLRRMVVVADDSVSVLELSESYPEASWRSLWLPTPAAPAGERWLWSPESPDDRSARYALLALVGSTLLLAGLALVIGAPLALLLALLVQLKARDWREPIKRAIELIEALPSILLGFAVLVYVAPWLGEHSAAAALLLCASLGLLLVPTIFSIADEGLSAVPRSLLDGALALGARPLNVFFSLTLPTASASVVAALGMGFGRALSETMLVLLLASMLKLQPLVHLPLPLGPTLASELPDVPFGSTHFRVLVLAALLLLTLSLGVHWAAERLHLRFRERVGALP
jgi:ABC-type phosphate transport system permease subunit